MPKWALFAARDGEVFRDEITLQSEEAAQAWAANKLAEEFGLNDDARYDLDEAFGQCDGALLEVASRRAIAAIVEKWAVGQLGLLTMFDEGLENELREERRACSDALARLADAARTIV